MVSVKYLTYPLILTDFDKYLDCLQELEKL